MEPWQQELQRQWQVQRTNSRLPKCQCCGEPVVTEQYLDLAPFGVNARACGRCVENNLYENLFEEQ